MHVLALAHTATIRGLRVLLVTKADACLGLSAKPDQRSTGRLSDLLQGGETDRGFQRSPCVSAFPTRNCGFNQLTAAPRPNLACGYFCYSQQVRHLCAFGHETRNLKSLLGAFL